jgi:CheY-like chemotaxis protein
VLAGASGNEAPALLAAAELADALVEDLSMPGLDGLAVIRTHGADTSVRAARIVVVDRLRRRR